MNEFLKILNFTFNEIIIFFSIIYLTWILLNLNFKWYKYDYHYKEDKKKLKLLWYSPIIPLFICCFFIVFCMLFGVSILLFLISIPLILILLFIETIKKIFKKNTRRN
jgi:amino acid transporter